MTEDEKMLSRQSGDDMETTWRRRMQKVILAKGEL